MKGGNKSQQRWPSSRKNATTMREKMTKRRDSLKARPGFEGKSFGKGEAKSNNKGK
ncbi:hypothetical protein BYT27DRAFT_6775977 [Phlegmacium glaucopus]|nr:hypothetical protein BYT27DRAFT_6775977 [Phlegmacium glaucopus]